MSRTVTITFDDGSRHVYQGVPDHVTPTQVEARASRDFAGRRVKAIDGGRARKVDVTPAFERGEASSLIPGTSDATPEAAHAQPGGFLATPEAVTGETALSMASSIPAGVAGNVAGAIETLRSGKYGTPEGIAIGAKRAEEVARRFTYEPRGELAKSELDRIYQALEVTGASALNPAETIGLAVGARAPGIVRKSVRDLAQREGIEFEAQRPTMAGAGAADTGAARIRRERAASMPFPMKLSKGQATRDFEQQRFERETAKQGKIGEPLRQHFAQNNQDILRNFDAFIDQTGTQSPTLRATGQTVDRALVAKANKAKAEIKAEYERARKAGEMASPVPTDGLVAWLKENSSKARNAPVIATIEDELVRLKGAKRGDGGVLNAGNMSINDMEELRKTANEVMGNDPTNRLFAQKVKEVIDNSTAGRGGEIYRRARQLRERYAREFEDHAVIDKLLSNKPGTRDRAVAFEDVFSHSILNGSLDDVRTLRKTLQTAGRDGEQAWRDLQGQTLEYFRDQATKNVARDERGNPIVSPAALDRAIVDLDRDGKLDFIFGKQGAQQLRDLNDLAKDVFVAPPGSVNYPGTASVILQALGEMTLGRFGIAARIITGGKKFVEARKLRQRVRDALSDEGPGSITDAELDMRVLDLLSK